MLVMMIQQGTNSNGKLINNTIIDNTEDFEFISKFNSPHGIRTVTDSGYWTKEEATMYYVGDEIGTITFDYGIENDYTPEVEEDEWENEGWEDD